MIEIILAPIAFPLLSNMCWTMIAIAAIVLVVCGILGIFAVLNK